MLCRPEPRNGTDSLLASFLACTAHALVGIGLASLCGCVFLLPGREEWDASDVFLTHRTRSSPGQAISGGFTKFTGIGWKLHRPDQELKAGFGIEVAFSEPGFPAPSGENGGHVILVSNSVGYEYPILTAVGPFYAGTGISLELGDGSAADDNYGGHPDDDFTGWSGGIYGEIGYQPTDGDGMTIFLRLREGLSSSFADEGDVENVLLLGPSIMFGVGWPKVR